MANKALKELLDEMESLIDQYFYKKTQYCNFDGYEELPSGFESATKDVISTCEIEIKYLDNEIDEKIERMEDEREYLRALKKVGLRPGEDI